MFTVFAPKSPFISGTPEPEAMYNLLCSVVLLVGPALNPIATLCEEAAAKLYPAQ